MNSTDTPGQERAGHTELPWAVRNNNDENRELGSGSSGWVDFETNAGQTIGSAYMFSEAENAANAAFIVRSVNLHDELVAALDLVLSVRMLDNLSDTEHRFAKAVLKRAREDQL